MFFYYHPVLCYISLCTIPHTSDQTPKLTQSARKFLANESGYTSDEARQIAQSTALSKLPYPSSEPLVRHSKRAQSRARFATEECKGKRQAPDTLHPGACTQTCVRRHDVLRCCQVEGRRPTCTFPPFPTLLHSNIGGTLGRTRIFRPSFRSCWRSSQTKDKVTDTAVDKRTVDEQSTSWARCRRTKPQNGFSVFLFHAAWDMCVVPPPPPFSPRHGGDRCLRTLHHSTGLNGTSHPRRTPEESRWAEEISIVKPSPH